MPKEIEEEKEWTAKWKKRHTMRKNQVPTAKRNKHKKNIYILSLPYRKLFAHHNRNKTVLEMLLQFLYVCMNRLRLVTRVFKWIGIDILLSFYFCCCCCCCSCSFVFTFYVIQLVFGFVFPSLTLLDLWYFIFFCCCCCCYLFWCDANEQEKKK